MTQGSQLFQSGASKTPFSVGVVGHSIVEDFDAIGRAIKNIKISFADAKLLSSLNPEALKDFLSRARTLADSFKDAVELPIQNAALSYHLNDIKGWIANLSDREHPSIGLKFIEQAHHILGNPVISSLLSCRASYSAFNFQKGFVNEIELNPTLIESPARLFPSFIHEVLHAFQTHASLALRVHSPFDKNTSVIIHPLDWVHVENLCERDSYAKQAWLGFLLDQSHQAKTCLKDITNTDVVSVQDFETAFYQTNSTIKALLHIAVIAMDKEVKPGHTHFTFEHSYHGVALGNYQSAMALRLKSNLPPPIFVRLDATDLWWIGNYGVGPNTLGENPNALHPRLLERPILRADDQKRMNDLIRLYNIPRYEDCPTRAEHESMRAGLPVRTLEFA
jgi:hypothetical protein